MPPPMTHTLQFAVSWRSSEALRSRIISVPMKSAREGEPRIANWRGAREHIAPIRVDGSWGGGFRRRADFACASPGNGGWRDRLTFPLCCAHQPRRRAGRVRRGWALGIRHVRNHGRRQPAEAPLARRTGEALARLEARGRRARGGQDRRHHPRGEAAGGRRHRHRQRRRAGAHPFRARLSRQSRRHRLRPPADDRHPRRPLQGRGADRDRPDPPQGLRPQARGERGARPHQAQAQIHPARPDDHRRHHRGRALSRPPRARPRLRRGA